MKEKGRKNMEKIILADGTGIEILEGASIGDITIEVPTFASLEGVADALIKDGNLSDVKFKTGDEVTGVYEKMKLEHPLFKAVDVVNGKVRAAFAIRKKTEMELAIEELQKGQNVQDGAIMELAGMMGGE